MKNKVKDFLQYVLDQWELDTVDIQDRALKLIEEL